MTEYTNPEEARTFLRFGPRRTARVALDNGTFKVSETTSPVGMLAGLQASIPFRPEIHEGRESRRSPNIESSADAGGVRLVYVSKKASSGRRHSESQQQRDSRWAVRGHWRQQWYASTEEHRRLWIDTHEAGRADAPVDRRDTVNIVNIVI